jgi:hypothetical protein
MFAQKGAYDWKTKTRQHIGGWRVRWQKLGKRRDRENGVGIYLQTAPTNAGPMTRLQRIGDVYLYATRSTATQNIAFPFQTIYMPEHWPM